MSDDEEETENELSYVDNEEVMRRASHVTDPFAGELEALGARGIYVSEDGFNTESTQSTEDDPVIAGPEDNIDIDAWIAGLDLGEVVSEDFASSETRANMPMQEKVEEAVSEDFASTDSMVVGPTFFNDVGEAFKFQSELDQALRMTTQGTPRHKSLTWRRENIAAYIAVLLALPGAMGEMISPQEQWANAISTLIWACMLGLVLYSLSRAITKFAKAFLHIANAFSAALTTLSAALATTLGVINTKLGVLVDAYIEYLKWMKVISLITAVATSVNSLIGLIRLPFSLFSKAASCSSSFCRMSPEGKYASGKYSAQNTNRYGFLVSTVLATCMFIFVPLWGFSKSFKCFEAPMRILEKLPYVTWLIDFMRDWSEGEATAADIPEDIHEFAKGKETRRQPQGLFDFGYGTSHLKKEHDTETCENDVKNLGKCGDGECYCKCHIKEEAEDAQSTIGEIAEGVEDVLENKAGLGSKARAYITKNQIPFVRSQSEPIESRQERLAAEAQLCERCGGDSKGKKICFECFAKTKTTLTNEEKAKVKERLCKECENSLEATSISVYEKCIAKKVDEKMKLNPEGLELNFSGWFVREKILWAVCQELGLEIADYLRIRATQFWCHVKDHKVVYAASAMTAIAVIVAAVKIFVSDEDDMPMSLTGPTGEILEGRTSRRNRVTMAPKQYASRRGGDRSRSGQARQSRNYVPSGGAEQDLDDFDTVSNERYEREQEERERALALEQEYQERKRDKEQQWKEKEQNECVHYANCPTMPMNIDAKNACNKACGGHHCAHFAGCTPVAEKPEGLPRKVKELQMKHFPVERKPVEVARAARVIRRAQRNGHHYTAEEKKQFDAVKRRTVVHMSSESLLGKTRQIHRDVASHVFKAFYDGEMTSSATIVADKVVVPLHSHIDGKSVSIGNATASAKLRGEIIPIADDLGVFYHYGAVSTKGWKMEVPTTGICMQLGFKSQDEIEPSHGVGFYSSSGLYDAPTEAGNCAGPVVSCTTGALIGFHIAGSDNVNRFIPLTEQLIQRLKMSEPVLTSSLFQ